MESVDSDTTCAIIFMKYEYKVCADIEKGDTFIVKRNTFDRIYGIVRMIPYGKVATYGQIAALAGNPRLSRVVGYALHVNPDPESIPCFRVVNRFGEVSEAFAFGGGNRQMDLLKNEGVTFIDGHVNMEKHIWRP